MLQVHRFYSVPILFKTQNSNISTWFYIKESIWIEKLYQSLSDSNITFYYSNVLDLNDLNELQKTVILSHLNVKLDEIGDL